MVAAQDGQGVALAFLSQPPGGLVGQSGCGGPGHDAQLPLQRKQTGIARFEVFVEVAAQGETAEQGGDGVGGAVAATVALAGVVQARGELLAVVGFEVVEGPLAQVQSKGAEQLLELAFKGVRGGGSNGVGTEGGQEPGAARQVAEQFFKQRQQWDSLSGCQQGGQ